MINKPDQRPTIKGIFVNSHVKALHRKKGDVGLLELEKRYGKPIQFKSNDNVPVYEEVKIIELTLDILNGNAIAKDERAFEAGRLHFINFTTTPLGKIIFSVFRKNFKLMMMQTGNIAGHVFKHVKFHVDELNATAIRLTMENNDYPIAHFKGFFQAWMNFAECKGTVDAITHPGNKYEYTMQWQPENYQADERQG